MAIDFLVVTYNKDLHFLEMQARSIAQFFEYDDINAITVVHNNLDGSRTPIDIGFYGKFKDKVNEVIFEDFHFAENKADYANPMYGWIRQQFCKLYFAFYCKSEWCYVVDSKTIFLRKYQKEKHFNNNGQSLWRLSEITNYFYEGNHWLENFFGLSLSPRESRIPKRATPIMMHVPSIQNLITDLYWKTKTNFFDWFIAHQREYNVAEFDLYFTYLRYKDTTDKLYEFTNLHNESIVEDLVLLRTWANPAKFDVELSRLNSDSYFTISAHKEFIENLTSDQITKLYTYLSEKQLFVKQNG